VNAGPDGAARNWAGRKPASRQGFVLRRGERPKTDNELFRLRSPYSDEHAGHDGESGANGHDLNFHGRHGLILSGTSALLALKYTML
jgi:hypothetical protein